MDSGASQAASCPPSDVEDDVQAVAMEAVVDPAALELEERLNLPAAARAIINNLPEFLEPQFRPARAALQDDEAAWAGQVGRAELFAAASTRNAYLHNLVSSKTEAFVEAGTTPPDALKAAESIERRALRAEESGPGGRERQIVLDTLFFDVLVPFFQHGLDAALGQEDHHIAEWGYGGANLLTTRQAHLLLVPTKNAPNRDTPDNVTMILCDLKGIKELANDKKISFNDRHDHPHHYTSNPRKIVEYADTPRGIPTSFSCPDEVEEGFQRDWRLVYKLRALLMRDSAIVSYGGSNSKFLKDWIAEQVEEGATTLSGKEGVWSNYGGIRKEATRQWTMVSFVRREGDLRAALQECQAAINFNASQPTPATLSNGAAITVDSLLAILDSPSPALEHLVEVVLLFHPSKVVVAPVSPFEAIVQDATLNDLVTEQGGIIANSMRSLYQSVAAVDSRMYRDWWRDLNDLRKDRPLMTIEEIRAEMPTKFVRITTLLLEGYDSAVEFARARGWPIIPAQDATSTDPASPILDVLGFVRLVKAVSTRMQTTAPFTTSLSTVTPSSVLISNYGHLPFQSLSIRNSQRGMDRRLVQQAPFALPNRDSSALISSLGPLPLLPVEDRNIQRRKDTTAGQTPFADLGESSTAPASALISSLGHLPHQSIEERAGQRRSDRGGVGVVPFSTAADTQPQASSALITSLGPLPIQNTAQRGGQRTWDTRDQGLELFSERNKMADPPASSALISSLGHLPHQSNSDFTFQHSSDLRQGGVKPFALQADKKDTSSLISHLGSLPFQPGASRKAERSGNKIAGVPKTPKTGAAAKGAKPFALQADKKDTSSLISHLGSLPFQAEADRTGERISNKISGVPKTGAAAKGVKRG